ncbi:AfsR/SARP family transcriptional regulator [Saccharopolyspora taberi]|uniref:OmpR/PhoB-type domain-containing protein n=1 Tax=Saccharopolyspora taberi TaxID=60895 RepID=A0ABN3VGL4_9PSEU
MKGVCTSRSLSFRVLGPLSVLVDNRSLPIPGGKQRTLLGALLLHANEVVPVDELVEHIWGDELPHRPRRALHTYLTRLRHTLARQGAGLARLIHTSGAGYLIEIPPDQLDLTRFRTLLGNANSAAGRGDRATESVHLAEALALWRGPVLPDVQSESLHRDVVPRITEDWVRATERYCDSGLALGRHEELVGSLRVLTLKYPFHERLWQHLMLALYRSGRRGEALAAYAEMGNRLREDLGVDPCAEVRHLHLAMLRDEVPGPRGQPGGAVARAK